MGMLVISRRDGESLHIGPDIQVRILSVRGNQVRIGIEAPKELAVYRSELKEQFEAKQGVTVEMLDRPESTTAAVAA